ncbi:MAG: hypothetical protein RLZZ618_3321 [Pseudomonadota bacterium]|jgi:hypothetical protein
MHDDLLQRLPPRAVLVHGGLHKTGSSAIQNTLAEHPAALAKAGWLYPHSGRVAKADTGRRHRQLMTELRRPKGNPCWHQLRDEIRAWPGRVLISHENFFSPQIAPAALREQLPGRDVYVLAYVRHPVDYVESCYREWIRRWKYAEPLQAFHRERLDYLDVAAQQNAWESCFGAGHVLLRPYDRSHFKGGSVLTDFLNLLGLPAGLTPPPGSSNDSLNAMQTLVGVIANDLKASPTLRDDLIALLEDTPAVAALRATVQAPAQADRKAAALHQVLTRPLRPSRVMGDVLVEDIMTAHVLPLRDALVAQGASPTVLAHSSQADLPHEAGFEDDALRQAIRDVLL